MTKTEAIEILQPFRDAMVDQHGCPISDAVYALDVAIETLKQPEQRWIPVTERLPEKRKYVLVLYKNNDMAVACWGDGDEDSLFWRAMIDEGWCTDCETDPTHWMPLPEPWKGENDERI